MTKTSFRNGYPIVGNLKWKFLQETNNIGYLNFFSLKLIFTKFWPEIISFLSHIAPELLRNYYLILNTPRTYIVEDHVPGFNSSSLYTSLKRVPH